MSESWQRVGALTELPGVVRELGADPAAIAASAGLDLSQLADRESRIPFASACLLVKRAADMTECDHIALLIAARNDTRSLGVVGALMRNAPSWGRAVLDLCENQHRYVRGGVPYLILRDGYAYAGYSIYERQTPWWYYFQEGAIAVGASMMREIAGTGPEEVLLMRRTPPDPQPYRRFFGCPVTFNATQSALVFPAIVLERRAQTADRGQRQTLETKVRDYWAVDLPRYSDQVIRLLRPRVVAGEFGLDAVASALAVHPRHLERSLKMEGTTFRSLLKQTQIDVAQRLLASTDLSVTEIGAALGYGDTSAFSNAFRRETGAAPTAWRAGRAEARQA